MPRDTIAAMAGISWHDRSGSAPPPTAIEIADLERTYRIRLPEDFRTVLQSHGARSPSHQTLECGEFGGLFSTLLTIADIEAGIPASFAFQQDRLADWAHAHPVRDKLMPIAIGGGQRIYCYDLRQSTSAPPIVRACLDVGPDDDAALEFVAGSFTELLEHLRV